MYPRMVSFVKLVSLQMFPIPGLPELQVCATTPGLWGTEDQTQDLGHLPISKRWSVPPTSEFTWVAYLYWTAIADMT